MSPPSELEVASTAGPSCVEPQSSGEVGHHGGSVPKGPSPSLEAQLWAEIVKARAEQGGGSGSTGTPGPSTETLARTSPSANTPLPTPEPILLAIRSVLDQATASPSVMASLDTTIVPGSDDQSLRAVLEDCVARGSVDVSLAATLAGLIKAVAEGQSSSSKKANKGEKRKRSPDELSKPRRMSRATTSNYPPGPSTAPPSPNKPIPGSSRVTISTPSSSLLEHLGRAIAIAKGGLAQSTTSLTQQHVQSIQGALHHVFLFCATSAVGPDTEDANKLQEITGLIHILGILHQVTIAPQSTVIPLVRTQQTMHNATASIPPRQLRAAQSTFAEIGTAVYPCLYQGCGKTFSKLLHLRKHESTHSFDKPFQCERCHVAFARKHDLQRHEKSHGDTVYQCGGGGCLRKFTRRDALRRHMINTKAKESCQKGKIEEVPAEPDLQTPSRRKAATIPRLPGLINGLEEGELPEHDLRQAYASVKVLHPLLQRHVKEKLAITEAPVTAPKRQGSYSRAASSTAISTLLSGYRFSESQTYMLEKAIAAASETARVQAELEASIEIELGQQGPSEGEEDGEGDGDEELEVEPAPKPEPTPDAESVDEDDIDAEVDAEVDELEEEDALHAF